ncbi:MULTISPECIES: sigma-70 family RNA polymerase sigma factor [unclassified Bradyrhizobium]|uniref:RNA polymerase sigma factor n=1 Tax=unclassified Bradyrhizobium TaxID=2631580 RepID=UPI0028EE5781|nr:MULTISPECIES: sigma-70 family RNA polymerase sigma factor [unclassified Bradyrhizobium]
MERTTLSSVSSVAVARSAADVWGAIQALSEADLVRLRALAHLWSRGLPGGLGWTDILHEAIVRVLDGSRPWPFGVAILPFLAGVMRSICDDQWRRARYEQRLLVSCDDPDQGRDEPADDAPDSERIVSSVNALADIYRLFSADPVVLKIIAGMACGLTAKDICRTYDISDLDYDTARRRMRRTLMRHQRTWSVP